MPTREYIQWLENERFENRAMIIKLRDQLTKAIEAMTPNNENK